MSITQQDITGRTPTRTDKTAQFYRKRAVEKITEYGRECGDCAMGLKQAIEYFAELDGRYSISTQRSIRSWFMQTTCDQWAAGTITKVVAEELADRIRNARPKPTTSKSTSAKKRKYVSLAEIEALSRWLYERADPNSIAASQFMRLAILTGLRPAEWRSARLLGAQLTYAAAKCTNDRGLVEKPSLALCGWPANWLALLEALLRFFSGHAANDRDWNLCMESMRSRIAYACKASGIARISPYSSRHVFVASEKLLCTDPVDLAIKLNHRTTRTQTSHYARRRGGLPMSRSLTAADSSLRPQVKFEDRRWSKRGPDHRSRACQPSEPVLRGPRE